MDYVVILPERIEYIIGRVRVSTVESTVVIARVERIKYLQQGAVIDRLMDIVDLSSGQ